MRVTAEQFNWRKEKRITGEYQARPPRTFRRGQSGSCCEECGRETEFLFASQDAMVCQRCRPLSELEQKEAIRDVLRRFNG